MTRLDKSFYARPATELAPEILGKYLCRAEGGAAEAFRVTETECYFGEEDSACHAHKGRTARTETLYAEGGVAYVYLCYGVHYLLNVVTGRAEHPEAVLIRGVDGADGPGRVTKLLCVDKGFNGEDLRVSPRLWLASDGSPPPEYSASPRVGINYADKPDRERLRRYRVVN